MTLAAAVVLSGRGDHASPVMSSYFVHPGRQGRAVTKLVNRSSTPRARRMDVCSTARWRCMGDRGRGAVGDGRGLAAVPVLATELAPVEDQSHISLFLEAGADSTVAANQPGFL